MSVEQRSKVAVGWAWGGMAVLLGLALAAVGLWHASGGGAADPLAKSPVATPTGPAGITAPGNEAAEAAKLAGAEEPARAARQVTATELFRQYRDSGGRAGEQYRLQRLGLSGTLASMEEGAEGVLMLTLQAGPDLETIRAVMTPAHRARALGVSPGTPVVLDCLHQGTVMGEPLLADCRLPR